MLSKVLFLLILNRLSSERRKTSLWSEDSKNYFSQVEDIWQRRRRRRRRVFSPVGCWFLRPSSLGRCQDSVCPPCTSPSGPPAGRGREGSPRPRSDPPPGRRPALWSVVWRSWPWRPGWPSTTSGAWSGWTGPLCSDRGCLARRRYCRTSPRPWSSWCREDSPGPMGGLAGEDILVSLERVGVEDL